MAEKQATKRSTQRSAESATRKSSNGFTAEEKAAMRERARELKAGASKEAGERDVSLGRSPRCRDRIERSPERIHAIVEASAPALSPRTWYGMPAYAKDGNVVFFFKPAEKFKARYATLGFSDKANLDDGAMWPTEFAIDVLTAEVEARIAALVTEAVGGNASSTPRGGVARLHAPVLPWVTRECTKTDGPARSRARGTPHSEFSTKTDGSWNASSLSGSPKSNSSDRRTAPRPWCSGGAD